METNQRILKENILKATNDLEIKPYKYNSKNSSTVIDMLYSGKINNIYFKDKNIDNEMVNEINLAIEEARIKLSVEYKESLKNMGIVL
jgi:hypothetical protein